MKMRICNFCGKPIIDKYVLQISKDERFFHWGCLRCETCNQVLNTTCHVKNGSIFCKNDYMRLCPPAYSCQGCLHLIDTKNEWVVKIPSYSNAPSPPNQSPYDNSNSNSSNATSYVLYHVSCLQCSFCKKTLNPGDKYVLSRLSQSVVCMDGPCLSNYSSSFSPMPSSMNQPQYSHRPSMPTPFPNQQSQAPPVQMTTSGGGRGKRGGRNGCRKQN